MSKRVEYGRYRVTWVKGRPYAAWSYTDPETGEYKRPRFALDVEPGASVAELRASLVAFAARQEREELQASSSTIAAILDAYVQHRERDGKIMRPIVSNVKVLKLFFGKLRPEDVSDDLCRSYTAERAAAGCSGSTIVTELGRLSTALHWARDQKIISADECRKVWQPHRSPAKERTLSPAECAQLIDASRGHVKLFVVLCLSTGARTAAALELTWDRVDFERDVINLRTPRAVDILKKVVQKGRSVVHMSEFVKPYLLAAKQTASSENVIEFDGKAVKSIKTAFGKARRRAGLEDGVSPHTLRHTFGTMAEQGKVPAEEIAKAMGHKNVATTKANYMHGSAELTKGAVGAVAAQLGPKLKVVKST